MVHIQMSSPSLLLECNNLMLEQLDGIEKEIKGPMDIGRFSLKIYSMLRGEFIIKFEIPESDEQNNIEAAYIYTNICRHIYTEVLCCWGFIYVYISVCLHRCMCLCICCCDAIRTHEQAQLLHCPTLARLGRAGGVPCKGSWISLAWYSNGTISTPC